jgi:hypothetical protein
MRLHLTRRLKLGSAATIFFVIALLVGGIIPSAVFANLPGSKFEGGDGNLKVDTTGNLDWNALSTAAGSNPQLNIGIDLPSGSGDNSFGQGTKEDNPNVTLVSGSIPPQKSDLTRFYEASQAVPGFPDGSHVFIYLAWERSNVLGNANMDFEINKVRTPCMDSTGPFPVNCTITRSNGDILVTYDFGGSGTPTIGVRLWNGSSWQPDTTVVSSESAVNSTSVFDSHLSSTDPNLAANTFGEAAIDLTASGVLGSGVCDFGQATTFLKSRSSSSFTSEIKDFVSPIATPLNPCSSITIIKHTLNGVGARGVDQNFNYTTTGTGLNNFALNDKSGTDTTCGSAPCNKEVFTGLGPGTYSVTEVLPVAGFAFNDLSCTATGSGTTASPSSGNATATATITLAFGGSATCTYTNQQQTGAIKITKTSSKAAATPLGNATFSITGPSSFSTSVTTGSDGTACAEGLLFGDYSVTETAAPPGYTIDDPSTHTVTVGTNGTCSSGSQATFSATDTPLTDLTITAKSEASGGTKSTITCTNDSGGANIGNSPQGPTDPATVAANGLKPGNYTCKVFVDP